MPTSRLLVLAGAVAISGLTACGTSSSTPSSRPAATATATASPATAVDYAQQFTTDMSVYETDLSRFKKGDTIASVDVIDSGQAAVAAARLLLTQTWPSNATADIHSFALALDTVNEDIQEGNFTKFRSDIATLNASSQVVRADLGLPPLN